MECVFEYISYVTLQTCRKYHCNVPEKSSFYHRQILGTQVLERMQICFDYDALLLCYAAQLVLDPIDSWSNVNTVAGFDNDGKYFTYLFACK